MPKYNALHRGTGRARRVPGHKPQHGKRPSGNRLGSTRVSVRDVLGIRGGLVGSGLWQGDVWKPVGTLFKSRNSRPSPFADWT